MRLEKGADLRRCDEMLPGDERWRQPLVCDCGAQAGHRQGAVGVEDGDDLLKGHRLVVRPVVGMRAALYASERVAAGHVLASRKAARLTTLDAAVATASGFFDRGKSMTNPAS